MIYSDAVLDTGKSRVNGIAAPIKGLNTLSPIAGLSPEYAIQLDNFICQPDAIIMRTGAADHKTGFATAPKTLMAYTSATANQLFAANANGIFNATAAGAIGASVAACTSGFGVSVNFATSAGQFMYFVNGVDTPKLYDGTTWVAVTGASVPAITGPTTTTLKSVETYRQRLFFLQNDFLGFYYMPADSVGGAAGAFRIGSLCRRGGEVVAHGTWSIDGGSGPDDHYVLATSEGEIVVFKGSDPAVAANWTYIGTYYVGKPAGVNCFAKYGGDLLYLCENGLIPMSELPQSTTRNYERTVTNKIQPTISRAFALYGTVAGWRVNVIPRLSLILINIPRDSVTSIQLVYNTVSKGWSSFSMWNAADFIDYAGATYFSTGNVVALAFTGTADFGNAITAVCDTSYNRFGTRTQLFPLEVRVLHATSSPCFYTAGVAQDFSGIYAESTYGFSGLSSGRWDSALWDLSAWGGEFTLRKDWVTLAARSGIAISTRFKVTSKDATVILLAIDYKFADQGLIS